MDRVQTYCRICEAACGMVAEIDGDEVRRLSPDAAHPVSRGFACVKGPAMLEVHRDPERLDHPERRDAGAQGGFRRASWPEALDDIAARLGRIRDAHGPDAVGVYIGNPTAFNVGLSIYAVGLSCRARHAQLLQRGVARLPEQVRRRRGDVRPLRHPADPRSRSHRLLPLPRLQSAGLADELRRHAARARAAQGDRRARRTRRVRQPAAHRDARRPSASSSSSAPTPTCSC